MRATLASIAVLLTACAAAPPPTPAATQVEPVEESAEAEPDADPPSASRTPPPTEEDQQAQERAARLRKRFEEDPPGESGARKFEDDYRRVFLQPKAQGASLESVECHRVICQAVVLLSDASVHNRLFIDAMRASGMGEHAATVASKEQLPGGKRRITVYVAQSGGLHD